MKSTVLIAALVAGFTLAALDVNASGRGEPRAMPDFATLDTDGNGTLTVAELEAMQTARFTAMDTDGNGAVSVEEMTAAGSDRMAKRAARMISRMDANEDGALQADEMTSRGPGAARMIEHADTDNDGEISEDEFDQAAEKRGGHRGQGGKGHGGRG